MDKKYRDTIPGIVRSLPPTDVSDDQLDGGATARTSKKKKSKKMGPGKSGLYVEEKGYITRWWKGSDKDCTARPFEQTRDELIKRRIATLRTRETKLQIILILEILALEMSLHKENDGGEMKASTKGRKRKTQDLGLTLELLVDRLCIWQSVSIDVLASVVSSTGDDPGKKTADGRGEASARLSNQDDLRDFCVEVIVPLYVYLCAFFGSEWGLLILSFSYAARLPDKCAAVSRKLGGPSIPSPIRLSKSHSSGVGKTLKRPGAVLRRSFPDKSRRTLERVLTDERIAQTSRSRQPSLLPSLRRSATAPATPGLKLEGAETPLSLSEIPAKDSRPMTVSRSGVLVSKGLRQREVDLSIVASRSADVKSRIQSVQLGEELKGAITALKKPNRALAVKDYVESCNLRKLGGASANKSEFFLSGFSSDFCFVTL